LPTSRFSPCCRRAAKKSPKASPTRRKSRRLAKTEADRQKILAEAGDLANKMIDEARPPPPACAKSETQKAIAAAEQIVIKAREAAAQERARMLAN
jgi:hypothetical protein